MLDAFKLSLWFYLRFRMLSETTFSPAVEAAGRAEARRTTEIFIAAGTSQARRSFADDAGVRLLPSMSDV